MVFLDSRSVFLPGTPLSASAPSGWTDTISGNSIQFTANSSANYIQPGQSLTGSGYQASFSPAQLAAAPNSGESVAYSAGLFSDGGDTFTVKSVPEPSSPRLLLAGAAVIRLYDFENKKNFFPEVHASFKFSILNFSGEQAAASQADFVFFAHKVEDLDDRKRHIVLSPADIRLLNPNTRTCPIFRTRRDAEITKAIYRRVPVLIDANRKGPTGNPWDIQFKTMFHQTNDAELFREGESLKAGGFKRNGNRWVKGKQVFLPLYEAKMVQAFDHRAADVVADQSNWVRQGQTDKTSPVNYQNPEHLAMPRFWVRKESLPDEYNRSPSHFLCYKDVTSPTNQRTMIAAMIPHVGVVNSAPIILSAVPPLRQCCLLANLNSFAYDFVVRQKISNIHLNFFIVEQAPTLPPDTYDKRCPWEGGKTLEAWISERVLRLTCTA
jgi:hypothetical protein